MQSIGLKFLYNNVGAIDQTLLNSDKRTSLDLLYQYKQNNMRVIRICVLTVKDTIFLDFTIPTGKTYPLLTDVIDPSQNQYLSISLPLAMV